LTDELLDKWAPVIERLELIPSSGGVFEVTVDDALVFSKRALGRHATDGEVAGLVQPLLGDPVDRG
jgi:selenoprotein W-related protein